MYEKTIHIKLANNRTLAITETEEHIAVDMWGPVFYLTVYEPTEDYGCCVVEQVQGCLPKYVAKNLQELLAKYA